MRTNSLVLFALAVVGCGTSVSYTQLNSPPHALSPRSPESVKLYLSAPPTEPFVEIGMIESQQQSGYSLDDTQAIYDKMREEAGHRGCDGLVVVGTNNATQISVSRTMVNSTTLKGYRASCIAFTNSSTTSTTSAKY